MSCLSIFFSVSYTHLEVYKRQEELGFSPEYDLERGVKETIAWYKDKGWL